MKQRLLGIALLIAWNSCWCSAPLHDAWNALLQKHVTKYGKVNYQGFISDQRKLDDYLTMLSDTPVESSWTEQEAKAYLINAYNAFTVKLITIYYPVKSIKDIGSNIQVPFVNTPWDIKFIRYGKDSVDLNFIEHGVLRKQYQDPRIHFALVCASQSCPVLLNTAYTAQDLDTQLDQQARTFLSDTARNKITPDAPAVSKIFDWYAMDFKTKKMPVIDYINKYSAVKIEKHATLTYLEYSWKLNE